MARKIIHPQPTDHEIEDCMDRGYTYENAVRIVRARNQHNRKRAKQGLAPAASYGRETGKLKRPRPSTRERRIDELNSLSASLFKRFHIDYEFTMLPTGTRYDRGEDRAITRTYKRRRIEGSELYMYSEVIYAEELQSDSDSEVKTIALDLPFFDESADMTECLNSSTPELLFCSKKRLGKPLTEELQSDSDSEVKTIALDLPFFDESTDMTECPNSSTPELLFCSKKRLGKPLTEEHRAKISASKKGMKYKTKKGGDLK